MTGFGTGLNSWYGWVHRYGSPSWIIAMKANASSCGTPACCEQSCPAITPPIPPLQFPLSFRLPLSSLLKSNSPYPRPFPIISLHPLPLTSLSFLIIHSGHMTVPPPRVLISSPTLRVKTDPLNGCSEVYGSRRRKKKSNHEFFRGCASPADCF